MAKSKVPTIEEIHKDLLGMANGMADDVQKLARGNKAAGRRLRKTLQEIKKQIKPWRDHIQATVAKL